MRCIFSTIASSRPDFDMQAVANVVWAFAVLGLVQETEMLEQAFAGQQGAQGRQASSCMTLFGGVWNNLKHSRTRKSRKSQ